MWEGSYYTSCFPTLSSNPPVLYVMGRVRYTVWEKVKKWKEHGVARNHLWPGLLQTATFSCFKLRLLLLCWKALPMKVETFISCSLLCPPHPELNSYLSKECSLGKVAFYESPNKVVGVQMAMLSSRAWGLPNNGLILCLERSLLDAGVPGKSGEHKA